MRARKTTPVVAETAARILSPALPPPVPEIDGCLSKKATLEPRPKLSLPNKARRNRNRRKLRRSRPSLSEQLASIGQTASNLTSSLQQQHGLVGAETPIYCAPSRHFVVGRLQSKFPSPVRFFKDCCKFSFHHPYEHKVVEMVMFYRDMRAVNLNAHQRLLRFRIARRLAQFGADYNEHNCRHFIEICFNSSKDMKQLETKVPRISNVSAGKVSV